MSYGHFVGDLLLSGEACLFGVEALRKGLPSGGLGAVSPTILVLELSWTHSATYLRCRTETPEGGEPPTVIP